MNSPYSRETARAESRPRLITKAQISPERTVAMRTAMVVILFLFMIAVFMLERAGLKDQIDGQVSALDVVYFVMITLTSVGYGDVVTVSDRARFLNLVLFPPVRIVIWLIFIGTAYQFVVQKVLEEYRLSRLQKKLVNHIVICGYGYSGRTAAAEIAASGQPPDATVVVDTDAAALQAAAELGHVGLIGDSTLEKTLRDAGTAHAKAVVVCVGRDDTAVLTVLTVRQLTKSAKIVCSVKEEENASLIRQAGADVVVVPARVSGYLLAGAVEHAHVSEYVADLISRGGPVRLTERGARPEEVGKRLRDIATDLVVRIHRGAETVGFWEGDRSVIQPEDVLLVIETEDAAFAEKIRPSVS